MRWPRLSGKPLGGVQVITSVDIEGLNTALNEATLLDVNVDADARTAEIALSVLTLPEVGPEPADPRLIMAFSAVSRVTASLRLGTWNNWLARVVRFPLSELSAIVRSFGGVSIYGWDFVDCREKWFRRWWRRNSLDCRLELPRAAQHTITVFQEDGGSRYLEVTLWFQDVVFRNFAGESVPLPEVVAGGKRWWDAFFANDPRTINHGMAPLV